MHRGEPQIYGTQYQVRSGVLELWTVRDPSGLDERRAALGLEPVNGEPCPPAGGRGPGRRAPR